jgi:Fusaric acid resistance protein-like
MGWLRISAGRLRQGWVLVVESTAAATVAWLVDTAFIGNPQPFFTPAAALIVLGQVRGQRTRRAVEIILGVAGGVLVADVVARALGTHRTWTIFTVILLTLTVAVAIGASTVSLVQAAVSALYLVVVAPSAHTAVPLRFVDALVGGVVALLTSQLTVARDPVRLLIRESGQLFGELASVLEELAAALDRHDEPAAREALDRTRRADAAVQRFQTAVVAAGEGLWLHAGLRALEALTRQMDYAVRNTRVLARAGVTLTRLSATPPPELGAALRLFAVAVRAVHTALATGLAGSGEAGKRLTEHAEAAVGDALRLAGQLLPQGPPLSLIMIVGQLRSTAIDVLRGAGADNVEILTRVDEALGLPPV